MNLAKTLLAFAVTTASLCSHAQQFTSTTTVHGDYALTVVQPTGPQPRWVPIRGIKGAKWPNNTYKWHFNPANIPAPLTADEVLAALKAAAAQWMQVCNIKIEYMGLTTAIPGAQTTYTPWINGQNIWGFAPIEGTFRNVGGYALPTVMADARIYAADIVLNSNASLWAALTVQAIATHEIGHAIGLDHSEKPSSMMYATPYHDTVYGQWLHDDDVDGVVALYGETPYTAANRVMNWAENKYPGAFLNLAPLVPTYRQQLASPPPTVTGDGFVYRYYQDSRTYLGAMNGDLFYVGVDRVPQNLGKVTDYLPAAKAATF